MTAVRIQPSRGDKRERENSVDTCDYLGDPIYQYSLARGIAGGFLAPYRVHRVITDYDAADWRRQMR